MWKLSSGTLTSLHKASRLSRFAQPFKIHHARLNLPVILPTSLDPNPLKTSTMNAFVPTIGRLALAARAPAAAAVSSVRASASAFAGRSIAPAARFSSNVSTPTMQMDDDEGGMDMDMDRQEGGVEESKLFIGNLSWTTTDSSLGDAFSEFGEVIDSKVVTDRFTGKSRGFGFITFTEAAAAEAALENMNGAEVDGRPIRIDRANKRVGGPRPRRNFY
jgi:cold-inducible RNA-binding protein